MRAVDGRVVRERKWWCGYGGGAKGDVGQAESANKRSETLRTDPRAGAAPQAVLGRRRHRSCGADRRGEGSSCSAARGRGRRYNGLVVTCRVDSMAVTPVSFVFFEGLQVSPQLCPSC